MKKTTKIMSQMQAAMRALPTIKYDEARALLERGRIEKLEAELQKRLNAIKGVDEEGRPRVVVSLEDRTQGRKPWVRQVPHTHHATGLRDYIAALEVAWINVRSAQEQVDVLMNQIGYHTRHEDRMGVLLAVAAGELKMYDRRVRVEQGYTFAEGHARPEWHVWRHRRDEGDTWDKNQYAFKTDTVEPLALIKKLKPFIRASGKWLVQKHGDRLKEFVLLVSDSRYVLYGLVAMSTEEIAKAREEAEISRRLRHAEKQKMMAEAESKKLVHVMKEQGVKKWRKPRKMPVVVQVGQTKKLTPRQEAGL